MQITTDRKIKVMSPEKVKQAYLNFDSKSTEDVKAFQSWYNANYTTPPFTNKPLAVDGVYGKLSKAAYAMYGDKFEQNKSPKKQTEIPVPKEEKPKEVPTLADKAKGLSMPAKIGIGVGVFVLLSLTIWAIVPKNKK